MLPTKFPYQVIKDHFLINHETFEIRGVRAVFLDKLVVHSLLQPTQQLDSLLFCQCQRKLGTFFTCCSHGFVPLEHVVTNVKDCKGCANTTSKFPEDCSALAWCSSHSRICIRNNGKLISHSFVRKGGASRSQSNQWNIITHFNFIRHNRQTCFRHHRMLS